MRVLLGCFTRKRIRIVAIPHKAIIDVLDRSGQILEKGGRIYQPGS